MDLFLKSHKRHRNIFLHKSYFSDSKRINMLIIINHIQFFYYSSYLIYKIIIKGLIQKNPTGKKYSGRT